MGRQMQWRSKWRTPCKKWPTVCNPRCVPPRHDQLYAFRGVPFKTRPTVCNPKCAPPQTISNEGKLNESLSSNEVYYRNSLILLVTNMLCSRHHCQNGFNLIVLSCTIRGGFFCIQTSTPLQREVRVMQWQPARVDWVARQGYLSHTKTLHPRTIK